MFVILRAKKVQNDKHALSKERIVFCPMNVLRIVQCHCELDDLKIKLFRDHRVIAVKVGYMCKVAEAPKDMLVHVLD